MALYTLPVFLKDGPVNLILIFYFFRALRNCFSSLFVVEVSLTPVMSRQFSWNTKI